MKIRNYLIIKAGEIILVIATLILCLAFKSHAQIQHSKVPVWGTTTTSTTTTISLNGNLISAMTNDPANRKGNIKFMTADSFYQIVN